MTNISMEMVLLVNLLSTNALNIIHTMSNLVNWIILLLFHNFLCLDLALYSNKLLLGCATITDDLLKKKKELSAIMTDRKKYSLVCNSCHLLSCPDTRFLMVYPFICLCSVHDIINVSIMTQMFAVFSNRFRTCLRLAGSQSANAVGNWFFNWLQLECFVFKPTTRCVLRAWYGKCLREENIHEADIKDPLSF